MEENVFYIKISLDRDTKENFYLEYSFDGIKSRKRFWISRDRDMKPFNKEVISNILRNAVLEITSNSRFWNLFGDMIPSPSAIKPLKINRKRRRRSIP